MFKIETLYNQGTAEEVEDGMVINPPFFGVIDGTSEPTHFIGEGISFNGLSGGEMVRKMILETFYQTKSNEPLESVILKANKKIKNLWQSLKIPLWRSDLTAGAVFAFVKLEQKKIKIIQGGDCFALWLKNSGRTGISKNQVYLSEVENKKIVTKLMKEHKGDRKKMWLEFYKELKEQRLRDVNKKIKTGYAFLNGQTALKKCWEEIEIPIKDLQLLLLFSDGFIPFKKEEELTRELLKFYKKGGLNYILKKKREFEKKTEKKSYRVYDEATAIVLKFNN